MPGGNPRIDEPGQVIEATVACARRSDDAVVFERIPFEIEIAEENRLRRHRRHLALGPARIGLRMAAAPSATFARCTLMDREQRIDLRQSRRRAQMAQVRRVNPHRPRAFSDDHGFERALLDAVLRQRAVFRQQVVAR